MLQWSRGDAADVSKSDGIAIASVMVLQ